MSPTARHSLLGIEPLPAREIEELLKLTRKFHVPHPRPVLRDRRIALLFYEASTRTRVSFEMAAKRLGALTAHVSATASSIEKGESLVDTGYTIQATGAEAIVIRHPAAGAPHVMAQNLQVPVINAGDGMHEHPTQALLDAFTILQHRRALKGLRVAIIGDILHSRVARSNVHLLTKLGAKVVLCGPPELCPELAAKLAEGVEVTRHADAALRGTDVVMMLRVQKERLAGFDLNVRDYVKHYQLTPDRLKLAKRDALLMHPGPVIRGLEMHGDLVEHPQSVVREQVANGVPVRMAVLARALGAA